MYYQVFIKQTLDRKESQFSCDSWDEVIELVEERRPKAIRYEAYNCTGLVGTAWKFYNSIREQYITYRKLKND